MAKQATDANLDKVRELLFGSHAEKVERKTKQIDLRLNREVAELRKEIGKRFDALEALINDEAGALQERILQEKADREVALKELSARITETGRTVGKRVTALQEQTAVNLPTCGAGCSSRSRRRPPTPTRPARSSRPASTRSSRRWPRAASPARTWRACSPSSPRG